MKLSTDVARRSAPARGIDAEVANFFAEQTGATKVVIDEKENKRLRWMVHKRVLTVMVRTSIAFGPHTYLRVCPLQVITYFAQTLDKGTIINTNSSGGELALLLTETNGGTRLSSTRYVHYGTITARSE